MESLAAAARAAAQSFLEAAPMPEGLPAHILTSARTSLAAGLEEALRVGMAPDLVKGAAAAACAAFEQRWHAEHGRAAVSALHNAGEGLDKPTVLLPIGDDLQLAAVVSKLHSDR